MANETAIKELQAKIVALVTELLDIKKHTKEESDAMQQEVYVLQRQMKALANEGKPKFDEEAYNNLQTEGYGW